MVEFIKINNKCINLKSIIYVEEDNGNKLLKKNDMKIFIKSKENNCIILSFKSKEERNAIMTQLVMALNNLDSLKNKFD